MDEILKDITARDVNAWLWALRDEHFFNKDDKYGDDPENLAIFLKKVRRYLIEKEKIHKVRRYLMEKERTGNG